MAYIRNFLPPCKTLSFQLLYSPVSPNLLSLTEPPLFSAYRPATGTGCCLSFPSLGCSERWSELPKHHSQSCCLPSFFAKYFSQILKNKLASRRLEEPNGAGNITQILDTTVLRKKERIEEVHGLRTAGIFLTQN